MIKKLISEKYGDDIDVEYNDKGHEKHVFIVTTSAQKLVITVDRKKTIRSSLKMIRSYEFQQGMFIRGINTAEVKELFRLKDGRIVACQTFVDGTRLAKLTPDTAYVIGEMVGKFHVVANTGNCYQKLINVKNIIFSFLYGIKEFGREFRRSLAPKKEQLPVGYCHRDLNLGNILFVGDKPHLIDFDRHRKTPYVFDIHKFFRFVPSNNECIDAFIRGYNTQRQLNDLELGYLSKLYSSDKSGL